MKRRNERTAASLRAIVAGASPLRAAAELGRVVDEHAHVDVLDADAAPVEPAREVPQVGRVGAARRLGEARARRGSGRSPRKCVIDGVFPPVRGVPAIQSRASGSQGDGKTGAHTEVAALRRRRGRRADGEPGRQAARFGFADDAGKYAEDGGAAYFADLKAAGGTENRITLHWDPKRPDGDPRASFLDRSLPVAEAKGVRVVFHVFPLDADRALLVARRGRELRRLPRDARRRTYPQVREFVVGNEPNQPRFQRPQFSKAGKGLAAAAYANVLARSYDALKAVDPAIRVIGLGLSGRGNDLPQAPSNASTSPVRFLRDLGAAYRASGRTLPLMDELGLHLYPRSDRDPATRRRPLAARGDRQPGADQAGGLGRVRGHGAADGRAGAEAPDRRDRLAGRRPGRPPRRLPRARDRGGDERAGAGRQLREGDRARGLRPQHLGRLLPPPERRRGPRAVPVGRPAGGRLGAAGLRGRPDAPWRRRSAAARRHVRRLAPRDARPSAAAPSSGSARVSPRRLRTSWGFNVTAAEEVSYVAAIFPAAATAQVREPRLAARARGR